MDRIAKLLCAILIVVLAIVVVLLIPQETTKGPDVENRPAPMPVTAPPHPTPHPTPQPTPTRTPSENDLVPTITPKITFVPIPTETIPVTSDGRTPSPTPAWATPYPSPTGEPTVRQTDTVLLGTVVAEARGVYVRKREKHSGGTFGTAHAGEQYAILEQGEEFCRVLYNGMEGYLPNENLALESLPLDQTGVVQYTIGSLNVHGVGNTGRLRRIAQVLRDADLDIVGVQEIDKDTLRTGETDWTRELAKAAGYPYYAFCPATAYDGGQFGTAILSRHPIIDAKVWKLDVAPHKEARALGYARILLEKGTVHVFNTHLCASKMSFKSVNIASLAYTLEATGLPVYAVTGDFNCSPPRLNRYMPDIHYVNMDRNTFGSGSYPKIIDNILYTDGLVAADVRIISARETDATDHDLVASTFYALLPEAS